jgi:UDP-N-acetylmuramate: L-alanyl-gamma-D-glutamyl-meso-diaminopimelate ligase
VHYRPRTAVLNNLEFDHADIFDDLAAIERQFHHLVRTVPGTGQVVFNAQEESLRRVLAQGLWSGTASFGTGGDWTAVGDASDFAVLHKGENVAQVAWALNGQHNQMNALAAIAAAQHVGVHPAEAAAALAQFQNVKRRMEVRGTVARPQGDITVYDDFAHHPTAIRTTVDGLRKKLGDTARILAVFEPRSNTMKLGAMKAQLPGACTPPTWRSATPAAWAGMPATHWPRWAPRPRWRATSPRWWPRSAPRPSPATTCCA